ncbi:MAG TPA: class I SAM-dependent methyltransferase [Ktedonobacterales bacterium]|jgi:16S rRNA (adenine(1408)-N(1))-methyltransferase
MESIQGKQRVELDTTALAARLAGYARILVDLGTGDGRFVQHNATACPRTFAIGVDSCREQLRAASRRAPVNALYLIASAEALPAALAGLADHITINFPWGSLQRGLLAGDPALLGGLVAIARPGARLELRLNGGALAEQGWSLDAGAERVRRVLCAAGFAMRAPGALDATDLRACPTTWARRLAVGRDPRAIALAGVYCSHREP